MKSKTIVMLAGKTDSTAMVFNSLKDDFNLVKVILEEPVSKKEFLQRRVKKLGYKKVLGQIFFQALVTPILARISQKRQQEIVSEYNLDRTPIPQDKIIEVDSVNDEITIKIIQELNPDLIVVNGTRIVAKKVLDSISAKFINTHAGITPLYRGVHGGYWALVEKKEDLCGVTIHLVDAGIDTGNILARGIIKPTSRDSFVTYPLLQLGVGIPLIKQVIQEILAGKINIQPPLKIKSKLRTHPTIWEYMKYYWSYGVK